MLGERMLRDTGSMGKRDEIGATARWGLSYEIRDLLNLRPGSLEVASEAVQSSHIGQAISAMCGSLRFYHVRRFRNLRPYEPGHYDKSLSARGSSDRNSGQM